MNDLVETARLGSPLRLLDTLNVPRPQGAPQEALADVKFDSVVIQDFRPLAESLEWELADLYWSTVGVQSFASGQVPFIVNNSGRASEDAAAVLMAACAAADELEDRFTVLELGAGTGLFARYLLDAFRGMCEQEGHDFYDRLVYVVTDRSPRSVEQWLERGLFDAHGEHAVVGVCDAMRPTHVSAPTGGRIDQPPLRAVFLNYVLDVLPAAVIRVQHQPERWEQLCVRTRCPIDRAILAQHAGLSLDQIRELAAAPHSEQRDRLLPVVGLLEFEAAMRPVDGTRAPYLDAARRFVGGSSDRMTLNYGALTAIEQCLGKLRPGGFILVNDYGPAARADVAENSSTQRFGGSVAVGLNFPLLEHYFSSAGLAVVPDGGPPRPLRTRLICSRDAGATRETFERVYGVAAHAHCEGPAEQARQHVAAGRHQEALESFHLALTRNPRDWYLLGQVAEFVSLQLRDFDAGMLLCRTAIELNPWYSAWLWNVLGDCLYCLQRYADAHAAYLQAAAIHPDDVRTSFNLSYTHAQAGAYAQALAAIAHGLAMDRDGTYRERLLDKQREILAAVSRARLAEQERLAKRSAVLAAGG